MSPGPSRPNPYVGPRAFTEGEPLFGRSREVRQLFQMLVARRIALLHSPSGAGKTSLIQAGLIPQLKADGFQVLPVARVNKEPPGLAPDEPSFNRYIYSLLLSLEERTDGQFDEHLANVSLSDYLAPRFGPEEDPELIILIVDQFEELLTVDPSDVEQKAAFFAQIGQALRNPHLWALFVIREDYLGALEPYTRAIPTRLANTFRLDLLEAEAASEAICRPAEAQGVQFAGGAAEALVDDLREIHVQQPDGSFKLQLGPYVEPVQLQVVCRRLWDRLDPDKVEITEADLEASGDVDESLAAYYAERLEAIAADENIGESERAVRQWIENKLITRDGIRHPVLMGQEVTEGLDNRAIGMLRDAHLVRAEERGGMTWFELAHDRLVGPVRQDNARWFELNLSLLQRQAERWKDEEYEKRDYLLLRGESLSEAEAWAESHPDELSKVDRDLLEASRKERERVQEEQKQQRALAEEQRKRAEEQHARAEEAEAASARNRRLTRVALAFFAVASVAAVLAGYFMTRANQNLKLAEAREADALEAEATAEHNANVARTREAEAQLAREDAETAQTEAIAAVAARMEADSQRLAGRAQRFLEGGNLEGALLVAGMAVSTTATTEAQEVLEAAFRVKGVDLPAGEPSTWPELACELVGRNLTADEWRELFPDEPYARTCNQYGAHISVAEEALLLCEGVAEARDQYAAAEKPLVDGQPMNFESWAVPMLLGEVAAAEEGKIRVVGDPGISLLRDRENTSEVVRRLRPGATVELLEDVDPVAESPLVRISVSGSGQTGYVDNRFLLLPREQACLSAAVETGLDIQPQAFIQFKRAMARVGPDFTPDEAALTTLAELESSQSEWPAIMRAAFDAPLADRYLVLCVSLPVRERANQACLARNRILHGNPALAHFVPMTRTEITTRDGISSMGQTYTFHHDFGESVTIDMRLGATVSAEASPAEVTVRDENGAHIVSGNVGARLLAVLPASGDYTVELPVEASLALRALYLERTEAEEIVLESAVEAPPAARLWRFEGAAGNAVTILMEASEQGDPLLRLLNTQDKLLQTNDDYGGTRNSRIHLVLPDDGRYFIDAGWFEGTAVVPYRLTLSRVDALMPGNTVEAGASRREWQVAGSAGDFVSATMTALDQDGFPSLRLIDADGLLVGTAAGETGRQTSIGAILPNDGLYFVQTGWSGEAGPYRLAVSYVEPVRLALGDTVSRADAGEQVWEFDGQRGDFVSVSVEARDAGARPRLRLIDQSGVWLAADEAADDATASLCGVLLSSTGKYKLETGWIANPGAYTLSLLPTRRDTLEAGRTVENAGPEQCLWQFEGREGHFVTIAMDALGASGDPTLSLVDEGGVEIASNDDNSINLNSRLVTLIPADGLYLVRAGWLSVPGQYSLSFTQVEPEMLAIGDTVRGIRPERAAWQFEGQGGDRLAITMDASAAGSDPQVWLYDEAGVVIASEDQDSSGLNSRLRVTLPQDGVYFINAGWVGSQATYSLTLEATETGLLTLPETSVEARSDQWSWQFEGSRGDLVNLAMEALDEGGIALLRLYDESGALLAESVDQEGAAALLSYSLPADGLYSVEAGWSGNPGRYRLTLTEGELEADLQAFASSSLQGALLLVEQGSIPEGLELLQQVELIERLTATSWLTADDYNNICWHGSLWDYAAEVYFACEEAVARDPENIGIIDSRGIGRALTGDFQGAIEDFRAFIAGGYVGNEEWRAERELWIEELEAGRNPFEDEELRAYLRENE